MIWSEVTMRRFTLLDGMIVIASLAFGLGLIRGYVLDIDGAYKNSSINTSYLVKEKIVGSVICILAPLTLGSIVIRLRGSEGRFRRPGTVAIIVATLMIVFEIASIFSLIAYFHWSGRGPAGYSYYFMSRWFDTVGAAVLAAWVAIWLTSSWRGESDWVENLGRLIGGCWIAMFFIGRIASAIW